MGRRSSMRVCLFCPDKAGNAEHVVAEWLSKAMDRRQDGIVTALQTDAGLKRVRPPIRFQSLTSKHVCGKCNNGWMSDLEAEFKNLFEPLVVPRSFDEGTTVNALLQDRWDLLARWLLKSAIVAQSSLPKADPPVISDKFRGMLKTNLRGQDLHVYAAEILEPDFAIKLKKGYRTFNAGKFQDGQGHKDGFNFSIQLNHLGLALISCPTAFAGAKSPYTRDGKHVMPIIPFNGVYPEGEQIGHAFDDFGDFVECIEVYATLPQ